MQSKLYINSGLKLLIFRKCTFRQIQSCPELIIPTDYFNDAMPLNRRGYNIKLLLYIFRKLIKLKTALCMILIQYLQ